MRRTIAFVVVAVVGLGGVLLYNRGGAAAGGDAPAGGGRGARPPMPVEFAMAKRGPMAEQILVVGNLIGAATIEVVPRANGRLQVVDVKLGDPVRKGQIIARVEDSEVREQVRGAEAAYAVAQASIRQRQADLKLAQNNLDRSRSLYERQLLPQQTFDDVDARQQAAVAQLQLAEAQFEASKARLEELKIALTNTQIVAPVDGFVGKRYLDPGAFASTNAPVASVVDIRTVRMVANLVERDMRRVPVGTAANVEVDAYPGETFKGRVSRVAPVFDPATRTAEIEIEVPNGGYRLKPGMYSRVQLTISTRGDAITVPRNALVDLSGRTGVFVAAAAEKTEGTRGGGGPDALTAKFIPVEIGIRDGEAIEITKGLDDGARIITTGASALKDGDRIIAANEGGGRGREGRGVAGSGGQSPPPGSAQGPSTGSGQGPPPGSGQGLSTGSGQGPSTISGRGSSTGSGQGPSTGSGRAAQPQGSSR
jgi:RND family efflux transporter MFP subunit